MEMNELVLKLRKVTIQKVINKISNLLLAKVITPFTANFKNLVSKYNDTQEIKNYCRQHYGQQIFTVDWFTNNVELWSAWLAEYKNKPNVRGLEIGSYEGRATCWLMDNILTHPTAKLYCIDTLEGSIEHQQDQVNMRKVKMNFLNNIAPFQNQNKIEFHPGYSQTVIRKNPKIFSNQLFDFIYIDGSHTAYDVLEDAVLCFRLLKTNGYMIFDDYEWRRYEEDHLNPKLAIDSWLNCFKGQYELIYQGYQLCVKKIL
jgi:predicted O-methyltransferase YrrM